MTSSSELRAAIAGIRAVVTDAVRLQPGEATTEQLEAFERDALTVLAAAEAWAALSWRDPKTAPEGENVLYLARSSGYRDSFCVGCLPTDDWKPEQIVGWVSLDVLKSLFERGGERG
jgi:hypothetical protein